MKITPEIRDKSGLVVPGSRIQQMGFPLRESRDGEIWNIIQEFRKMLR